MAGRQKKTVLEQSGVVPVFDDKIVLITTRRTQRWVIPKGYLEKGLSPAESAAKEAYEEAGLIGRVAERPVGKYRYRKLGRLYMVQVYPMYIETVLEEWEEMHERQRAVVSPVEAVELLHFSKLKSIVAAMFGIDSAHAVGHR